MRLEIFLFFSFKMILKKEQKHLSSGAPRLNMAETVVRKLQSLSLPLFSYLDICKHHISAHCSPSATRAKSQGEMRNLKNNAFPRGTSLFVFTRKTVSFATTSSVCIEIMHFHDLWKAFSMKPLRR